MKILHTIPGFNISSGGPTMCTYHLIKGLRSADVDVDILTLSPGNSDNKIIGNDDFIKVVPNDTVTPFAFSRNFRKYLKEHTQYELYHANALWSDPTHATLKYARKQHKPCIITSHGMLYPHALKISALKKKVALSLFQRKDLQNATCLQATCLQELQHIRHFGLTNPVAVVPNCLNINLPNTPRNYINEKKRFGFIGRVHRIKNMDGLLKAWIKLNDLTRNAELLIIGSGDATYESELRRLLADHHIKNVLFTGFLVGDALEKMIRSLDYLVLPSHSENFGMVVPEALIKGIPVIASKGTPWEELNTHHCGWWVDNDVDALATTLEAAMDTPEEKRQEMGRNGQKLVMGNYSTEVIAKKMIRLYEWILNGGEKPEFVF